MSPWTKRAWPSGLGLRTINLESINHLRQRMWQRLLANYNFAQQSCDQDASFCFLVEDMETLREQAAKFQVSDDSYYIKWAEPSRLFHAQYLDEQLRKAALFPQTSSEIDRFGDYERNGDEMNDRLFLLTFDSAANASPDNTAWVAEYLRKSNMSGTFFVLGKDIQARLAEHSVASLQATYSQQCIGVQGWEFRSHSHWQDWQDSVRRSVELVKSKLPENYVPLFRPPDGQRRSDAEGFFKSQGLQVALWDIDAQDGAGKLKANQSGAAGADPDVAVAPRGDQLQCEAGCGENGDALADHANGAKRDRMGRLSGRFSLKRRKASKHWGWGDFRRDFDAGGLPTLTG